jgi:ATP-dependent helicase HrpA
VHPGFLTATGREQLLHLPRYLEAIDRRLDKLVRDPHRDRALMARVALAEQALERLQARRTGPEVAQLRWLVEELRVSLFAQSLGTPRPVSEQRVMREIDALV